MRTFVFSFATLLAFVLLVPATAQAQWCPDPNGGAYWCGDPSSCVLCSSEGWSCDTSCTSLGGMASTCGQAAGNPANDLDGDGVLNTTDNCLCTPNTPQTDCDGDNVGNVCDSQNANYRQVSNQRCMIDRDVHATHYDLEDWWEIRYVDISSCGAPDTYTRYKNNEATCAGFPAPPPVQDCCLELIVNDTTWCSQVDQNFCH